MDPASVRVLLAGVAPAAISFAAGQAAFTLTLVILFNLIKPAGWQVGLLRLEDIALGCGVSIVVGLLFWPRGASAVLRQALADAYAGSAAYLAGAVEFGILRCTSKAARPAVPAEQATRAAAADRRLDDAFRAYLAEHGRKPVPLADVTRLVTGASGVRLAAGAVLDLWRGDPGEATDRSAARGEILQSLRRVTAWYDDLAASLIDGQQPHDPLAYDQAADGRLIDAVRSDLDSGDSEAAATAVRIVWTGDHLDATRRLQETIAPAAQLASRLQRREQVRRGEDPVVLPRAADQLNCQCQASGVQAPCGGQSPVVSRNVDDRSSSPRSAERHAIESLSPVARSIDTCRLTLTRESSKPPGRCPDFRRHDDRILQSVLVSRNSFHRARARGGAAHAAGGRYGKLAWSVVGGTSG